MKLKKSVKSKLELAFIVTGLLFPPINVYTHINDAFNTSKSEETHDQEDVKTKRKEPEKEIKKLENDKKEEVKSYLTNLSDFYQIDYTIMETVYSDNYDTLKESDNPELELNKCLENYIKENQVELEKLSSYDIGTSNKENIDTFKQTDTYQIYLKYCNMYGVDPALVIARDMQESALSTNCEYNPKSATGPSQIEYTLIGSELSVYNFETNCIDTEVITIDKITNLDTNIKIGIMRLKKCLEECRYNIYAALQKYNYGLIFDKAIQYYASDKSVTCEEVLDNINDLGWLYYINDIHSNPSKYISSWQYETYGDNEYISRIMKNIYDDDKILTFQTENGNLLINLNANNKTIVKDELSTTIENAPKKIELKR